MQHSRDLSEYRPFREVVRSFLAREVIPFHSEWNKQGQVDREVWRAAGKTGLLGFEVPEDFGGAATADFRFNALLNEEIVSAGAMGLGFTLHNDVITPYLIELTTPEQKQRWLPGFCSGDLVTAIAMTEPGTGSDLRGIRTRAVPGGRGWVLSGAKAFITNGLQADLVLAVARTPDKGLTLFAVPADTPGFSRGPKLAKIGLPAQDTAELFFDDAEVETSCVLGEVGAGLRYLKKNLPRERLSISVRAVASARRALDLTVRYCRERTAFGTPIGGFQATRFRLAEMATEIDVAGQYVEAQIDALNRGQLTPVDAAMGKWWTTDVEHRVMDSCLQLHGGYGYMMEQPIARMYLDSRVQPIYGGTNEIMKDIIGRAVMAGR
jgi:alkylation response protein AidB-like acyl-CoA dehydrogenase